MGFPCGSAGKESTCSAGDLGLIPGLGRSPGKGNGNLLQYFAWEILWTKEPGRLQSMGSQRVGHDLVTKPPPPVYPRPILVFICPQCKVWYPTGHWVWLGSDIFLLIKCLVWYHCINHIHHVRMPVYTCLWLKVSTPHWDHSELPHSCDSESCGTWSHLCDHQWASLNTVAIPRDM